MGVEAALEAVGVDPSTGTGSVPAGDAPRPGTAATTTAGRTPDEIAAAVWHTTQQHRSAWSFEVEVRPFREKW